MDKETVSNGAILGGAKASVFRKAGFEGPEPRLARAGESSGSSDRLIPSKPQRDAAAWLRNRLRFRAE